MSRGENKNVRRIAVYLHRLLIMVPYFTVFIIMLICVIFGVYIGLRHEIRISKKAEYDQTRSISVPNEADEVDCPEANAVQDNASSPDSNASSYQPCAPEIAPEQNNADSVLSQKVSAEFDEELDDAAVSAIEEKMRHQDASFNTLNTHVDT